MYATVELIDSMGDSLSVVNAARASMDKEHEVFQDDDARLLKYLAHNEHWTPFAHVVLKFRINAPIFIQRQWFRSEVGVSRTSDDLRTINEVSRRYVDTKPEFFTPEIFRSRPESSIKQGSGEPVSEFKQAAAAGVFAWMHNKALVAYNNLLTHGIAPEQARAILPQTMMTTWIETGSLAYWYRFWELRTGEHAQKEIQEYAHTVGRIARGVAPEAWGALADEL